MIIVLKLKLGMIGRKSRKKSRDLQCSYVPRSLTFSKQLGRLIRVGWRRCLVLKLSLILSGDGLAVQTDCRTTTRQDKR